MKTYQVKTPSNIITSQLGIPLKYKQECIEECYKIGDKQNQQTNVKGIMSSYWVWEETDKFNPIFDNIIKFIITEVFQNSDYLRDARLRLVLNDAWSAIYKKGHFTIAHRHTPAHLSWVYYLKANGDSPLVFDECDFKIEPEDDMLVVFESNLLHSVGEHMGEDDRICLAGNVKLMLDDTETR